MHQRLFIGLDLPQDVRESLVAVQPQLPGLRTVPIDNLHLTLHFLGAADPTLMADLISQVAATQQPFEFRLSGVGYFEGRSNSLILWVGVELNAELMMLHRATGDRLSAAGFAIEQRPYRPHITLVRGENIQLAAITEFLQTDHVYSANVPARDLCLFRSETRPDGPVYSVVQRQVFHPTLPTN